MYSRLRCSTIWCAARSDPVAGLLSALALAVTPIIVTSRNNTTIRVPVHMTEKIRKVSRASGELSAELG